jgi:hypothetical protein
MSHDSMPPGPMATTLPAFKAIGSLSAPASPKRTLNIQAGCR